MKLQLYINGEFFNEMDIEREEIFKKDPHKSERQNYEDNQARATHYANYLKGMYLDLILKSKSWEIVLVVEAVIEDEVYHVKSIFGRVGEKD